MKAHEVLNRYANGERDFRRANLRGQSFKGQDLSGADFTEADIRGANFSNAILKYTDFTEARAGLQRRGITILLLISFLLSVLSEALAAFAGVWAMYLLQPKVISKFTLVPGIIVLVMCVIFFLITIRQGLVTALTTGSVITVVLTTGAVAITAITFGPGTMAVAVAANGGLVVCQFSICG